MFFSPAYSCAENNKALSLLFQLLIIPVAKISRFLSFAITSCGYTFSLTATLLRVIFQFFIFSCQ